MTIDPAQLAQAIAQAIQDVDGNHAKPNNGSNLLVNVAKYGVGSLIGLYLAWQMGNQLPVLLQSIQKTQAEVEQVQNNMLDLNGQHQAIRGDTQETKELMIKALRGVCIGVQPTKNAQKEFCNF